MDNRHAGTRMFFNMFLHDWHTYLFVFNWVNQFEQFHLDDGAWIDATCWFDRLTQMHAGRVGFIGRLSHSHSFQIAEH